jgi:hypothetical protein
MHFARRLDSPLEDFAVSVAGLFPHICLRIENNFCNVQVNSHLAKMTVIITLWKKL